MYLDGFDELPREQRQKESVYIQLIKGRELPEATIIITSRPSVSADLRKLCRHNIDRRLEILGFTGEDVVKYAKSVFNESETQRAAFLQYINGNPIIKGMMYLPLNAVIVAMIFKDSYGTDCPFPKTMTQLFDALTRSLIRRHLVHNRMITDDYCMPQPLQCIEDITKLGQLKIHDHPEISVADQFVKLAKMAYDGLLNEEYVFSRDGDFDHLGLMKKTKSLDVSVGPKYSLCFLHLTLQEYLSAIYISLHNGSIKVPPSIGMVSRFLAGLCIHGNDFLYPEVKNSLGDLSKINPVQVVRCVYECSNIVQKIPEVKDWFDHQDLQTKIDSRRAVGVVTQFDYYLVGHCIRHIGGSWSVTVSSQVEADFLVQGLGSDDSKGELQELKLFGLKIEHVEPLLELCHHNLQSLELSDVSCSESDATILCKYIKPALKRIHIGAFCKHGDVLLSVVFNQSSLDSLTIDQHAHFDSDKIGSHTVSLLKENSNIKNLAIPAACLIPLAPALHDNTSLVLLKVQLVDKEEIINHLRNLTQIIKSNHTLQQLEVIFYNSVLSDEVIQAIVHVVDAAAYSPSIKEVTCTPSYHTPFSLLHDELKSMRNPTFYLAGEAKGAHLFTI